MKILIRMTKEAKRYKWQLMIAMASTVSLTLVNLIAPRMLSEMISIVSAGMDGSSVQSIIYLAFVLLGLYLLRVLFRFLSNYMAHVAAWKLVEELRVKLYNKLQSFSIGYYHDKQTGDLMSRVITDTDTIELLYAHILPETITNIITLTGVTVILLTVNWKLALLTCIPIPFILLSGWLFATKVRPNFRRMQKARGEFSAELQDNFSGVMEIQVFGQQERVSNQVHKKASKVTRYMLHALKLSGIFHPSVEFLTALGTVIVVGFGGYFAFQGSIDVADIVAFFLYLSLFYAPITGVAQLLENAQQSLAGAERIIEVMDTPDNIVEKENPVELADCRGNITFDRVSFSYTGDAPVLKDVSFDLKAGQMLALVGATGVGKTTLTQLLSRFYDPTAGRILIDGVDIRDISLSSLHKQISVVLQDTFLFNATIYENIAFGKLDATTEEIERAAKIARIHDDIMEMSDQYDTLVGERGTRLSGGQKQRIAIARAVLCDCPILILDEATASVDVQTEAGIQESIRELSESRTVIAIAHRLSTVKNADLILVFEEGRIIQRGTHEELSVQDGLYRQMCQVQEEGAKLELKIV